MDHDNSIDLYRTEPGSLAGRYLRSFGNRFTGPRICRRAKRRPCAS
jgi:hypothetical protein